MTTTMIASTMRALTLASGAVRVEVEFPPKDAHAALALFGQPGATMAVAALREGAAAASTDLPADDQQDEHVAGSPIGAAKGGPLARLAGMWCNTPAFQTWIRPVYDRHLGGDGQGWGDLDEAAVQALGLVGFARRAVVVICDISSRRELDHNARAAKAFNWIVRIPFSRAME